MINYLEFILFLLFCLYVLKEAVSYGIYEYKNENKFGGTCVIIFSIFTIVLNFLRLFL